MRKSKGFTLIELLAVIGVLAVIALIATPIVLNMVNTAKKGSVESSATAYIKAVEKSLILGQVENGIIKQNGIYNVSSDKGALVNEKGKKIELHVKGQIPTQGQVIIKNNEVESARMCFKNYSVHYDGTSPKITDANYCESEFKVTLFDIEGKENVNIIGTNTSTTFGELNITSAVSVGCDNGAIPSIEDNELKIEYIYGSTTCTINDSLEKTIEKLDLNNTNIVVLADDEIKNTITIAEAKNVTLNLNEKELQYNGTDYAMRIYGILTVKGNNSSIVGTGQSLMTIGESVLNINDGLYNALGAQGNSTLNIKNSTFQCSENKNNCYPIYLKGNSNSTFENIKVEGSLGKSFGMTGNANATVNGANFECVADNCVWFNSTGNLILNNVEINASGYAVKNYNIGIGGTININNSTIVAGKTTSAIEHIAQGGTTNINNSTIQSDMVSLYVRGAGTINVKDSDLHTLNESSDCVFVNKETLEDTYINIYNTSIDSDWSHGIKDEGLATIYIKDSNVTANSSAVVNSVAGIINVNGGTYTVDGVGNQGAISNRGEGTINICSGTINGLESKHDLYNQTTGYIKYKSNVSLKNNTIYDTNNPIQVILDDTITCS